MDATAFCSNHVWKRWFWPQKLMPGTFVLQQDTLSTLLLSTQVYKWVPGRMWRICCVCNCLNANIGSSARNAPLGVEIVHCKCGLEIILEIVSNDRGNNTVAPWTSSLDGYVRIINAAIIIIINAPRFESAFWNAVYSKSAFWNAVYSKISMDATAFCSNHVWKRWFWPQKLSINAPLVPSHRGFLLWGLT